ncbi:MAG: hypothetical protein PHI31_00060 [Desulfuromonadaceae bacterium]|nr:hypothetical protein [Desulfuromonadaceae bacterium]
MKKTSLLILAFCTLCCLSSTFALADVLYVQPFKAKIYSKPTIASEVFGIVDSGFKFISTGRERSWISLVFNGKQGFIPAVQTAHSPPLGKSIVQSDEISPKLGARARVSSSSAVVAGMKGLTYEDRARVTKGERSDYDTLDKIDAQQITPDELKTFKLEGGLQ